MTVKGIDVEARWFAGKGRPVAAVTPIGAAGGLRLVSVAYADGGPAEWYLDVPEGFAWAPLLEAGGTGPIELRGAGQLDFGDRRERVPATDQSNTLVAIGERVLVKAYRRLQPGPHPEVELLAALAGSDAPVPRFLGSLHWVDPDTTLALLQEFIPDAEAGWEAPIDRAAAMLRGEPGSVDEWHEAGRIAAELHASLAAAFPLAPGTTGDLEFWRAEAEAFVAEAAISAEDAAEVRARLARLTSLAPPQLTRIHGDLHVAQLLRGPGREPLVIDFEGDPLRPLADRLRPDTPLRDLACLLRSVDHAGSAASRRAGGAAPDAWIAEATAAVLDGYAAAAPVELDRELLALLELAKECAEFVYAQRVLPEWLYAPREALARLLADP
jgi:predicted trehalose synthase